MYYYASNGPIAENAQLDTSNYIQIKDFGFGSNKEEKSGSFFLGRHFDRFYIAIKESGSGYFTLTSLKVSYNVCRSDPEGLVVYPSTPIGSAAIVSAKCKNNECYCQSGLLSEHHL